MGPALFVFCFSFTMAFVIALQFDLNILRAFIGAGLSAVSAMFLGAVFLHWTANTSASDERMFPTLIGLIFGILAFATIAI